MHAVTQPIAPVLSPGGALRIHAIPAASDNLVWGIECLATGTFAVVDGPGADEVEAYEEAHGLHTTIVLTTHTHGDHIGIHRAWASSGRLEGMTVIGSATAPTAIPGLTRAVDDGDPFRVGTVEGRVMRTEGHIDGHISFVIDGALFCGDTLFAGGCGYLFDGPPAAMFDSLMRLAALPDATLICCAHEYTADNLRFACTVEPDNEALVARQAEVTALRAEGRCTLPSTMGAERATNPFLRPGSATIRAAVGLDGTAAHAQVFAATRALKDTGAYKR